MKTVLFFSLFVIWNVFGVEGEFDGSPRIKAMKVKDITSAEMCAGACQSKADMSILDCLIWRYNKKTKRCIINFVKAKPNRKSTFGFPSSAQTTPPPPPPPIGCPEGWSEHEGSCYKLHSNKLDWDEAEANCRSYEGGNLASPNSEKEWDIVEGLMEAEYMKNDEMGYWLCGWYDNGMPYEWHWCDESTWGSFTNWEGGVEPTDPGKCLQAYRYRGDWIWYAVYCDITSSYVCKIQG